MRRIATSAVLAVGIAVGLLAHAPAAWGCSCRAQTLEQGYAAAAFVFTGRVQRIGLAGDRVEAQVSLDEIFKGRLPAALAVHTPAGPSACGFTFVRGSRYTIFAVQDAERLTTNACMGTTDDPSVRPAVRALAEEEVSRALIEPGGGLAEETPVAVGSSRAGPIAAATLMAAAVALLLGWVGRTRQAGTGSSAGR